VLNERKMKVKSRRTQKGLDRADTVRDAR